MFFLLWFLFLRLLLGGFNNSLLHLGLLGLLGNNCSLGLLLVLACLGKLVGLHASFLVGTELLHEHVVTLFGDNSVRVFLYLETLLLQELHNSAETKVKFFLYFI